MRPAMLRMAGGRAHQRSIVRAPSVGAAAGAALLGAALVAAVFFWTPAGAFVAAVFLGAMS
jgi:hypothetical protein